MNTYDGFSKTASSRLFLAVWLTVGLVACSNDNTQVTQVPIEVSRYGSTEIDIDLVIENSRADVGKALSGAYLTSMSVVAPCEDLAAFRGEINLDFAQVRQGLLGERIIVARATIDTQHQSLTFAVQDETDQNLGRKPLVVKTQDVKTIAGSVVTYLKSTQGCRGTIVLARVGPDIPWRVRCGPPDKVFIECLEIDPNTGQIKKLP